VTTHLFFGTHASHGGACSVSKHMKAKQKEAKERGDVARAKSLAYATSKTCFRCESQYYGIGLRYCDGCRTLLIAAVRCHGKVAAKPDAIR
jgi:hypothetical protein